MAAIAANFRGTIQPCTVEYKAQPARMQAGQNAPADGMRASHGKGSRMKRLLMCVMLAVAAVTLAGPVRAQYPSLAAVPPQAPPPTAYPGNPYPPYPILAPTPRDAYRDGTINRWELEQLEGPLPQALQGPSVDGSRGGDGGGGGDRGS